MGRGEVRGRRQPQPHVTALQPTIERRLVGLVLGCRHLAAQSPPGATLYTHIAERTSERVEHSPVRGPSAALVGDPAVYDKLRVRRVAFSVQFYSEQRLNRASVEQPIIA